MRIENPADRMHFNVTRGEFPRVFILAVAHNDRFKIALCLQRQCLQSIREHGSARHSWNDDAAIHRASSIARTRRDGRNPARWRPLSSTQRNIETDIPSYISADCLAKIGVRYSQSLQPHRKLPTKRAIGAEPRDSAAGDKIAGT